VRRASSVLPILLAAAVVAGVPEARSSSVPAPRGPAALASATPGPHAGMRLPFIERFTGKPAPPFALKDLKGRTIRLADYRGKVVLINFWYSTCPPCRKETPDLMALHGAYKDHGFSVLGISMDEVLIPQARGKALEEFLKGSPLPYPILIADQKTMDTYGGIPVQPISFLVDRAGIVSHVYWGAFSGDTYERALRPLLAAPGARPATPLSPGP
jgi:peroxiredoxin